MALGMLHNTILIYPLFYVVRGTMGVRDLGSRGFLELGLRAWRRGLVVWGSRFNCLQVLHFGLEFADRRFCLKLAFCVPNTDQKKKHKPD